MIGPLLDTFNEDCAKAFAHFGQGASEEALLRVRRAGEEAAELIIRMQWPQARADRELRGTKGWDRLRIVERHQLAPAVVISNLHVLRTHGNIGVHAHAGNRELNTAFAALAALVGHLYAELLHRPVPTALQLAMDQADPARRLEMERDALLVQAEEQRSADRSIKEAEHARAEDEKRRLKSEQEATRTRLDEVEQHLAQLREVREQAAVALHKPDAEAGQAGMDDAALEGTPASTGHGTSRKVQWRKAWSVAMAGLLLAVVAAVFLYRTNTEKRNTGIATAVPKGDVMRVRIMPFAVLQDDPSVRLHFGEAMRARFTERAQQFKVPVEMELRDTAARLTAADVLAMAKKEDLDLVLYGELYEPTSVDSGRVALQYVLHRLGNGWEQGLKDGLLFRTLADPGGMRAMATAMALFDRSMANFLARRGRDNEALAVLYASKPMDGEEERLQIYFRAGLHLGQKDYAIALRECQGLLDRTPDDPMLLALMGKVLLANGDLEAAKDHLDRALALAPNNVEALLDKARAIMRGKAPPASTVDEIYPLVDRALGLDTTNARAWQYAADIARVKNRWPDARRLAERSIALDSTNMEVRMMLAEMLARQLGQMDTAVVVLRAILRDRPDHVGALTLLGSIYAESGLGSPEEAKKLLERAKELTPEADYVVSCGLGSAAEAKGDHKEALKQYQAAWAIDQSDPVLCLRIAKLLLQAGQYVKTRDQLLPCLPRDSMGHNMNLLLGLVYEHLGTPASDQAKARFHLERALLTDPDDTLNLLKLGNALGRLGDLKEAQRRYRQLLELVPGNYEANNGMASLLANSGDRSGPIPYYRAMLKARPNEITSLSNLAVMLYEQGPANNPEVYSLLKRALAIAPNDASCRNSMAMVQLDMGDYAGASENYWRAVALDPKYKYPLFEARLKEEGF